jgi:hypothetical protein
MARNVLGMRIAGITLEVEGSPRALRPDLDAKYASFLTDEKNETAAVKVVITSCDFSSPRDEVEVTHDRDKIFVRSESFSAVLDLRQRSAHLETQLHASAFDVFLRIFFSFLLLGEEGFLIHAAGLEKNGRGYLFTGPSDSGKTTVARTARGVRVLNDELVAVKKVSGGYRVFSTPFKGDFTGRIAAIDAPLERLFFLVPHLPSGPLEDCFLKKHVCAGRDDLRALSLLLRNVFFFGRDKVSNGKILNICHDVVRKVAMAEVNILAESRKEAIYAGS